jgi:DNA-binding NarL/FixJ family response regulator
VSERMRAANRSETSDVRVFVVDDHESFRHAVAAVVDETAGFVVVGSAESGEQSLELMSHTPADLVLMDVNLPGITGIEASRRLTAEADPPVVVLLSTYDEGELDYGDCGAAAYITKSAFGPDRLADVWSEATA